MKAEKSPVLFIVFNRPRATASVFEEIRKYRPPRLYVAADGPRNERQGEAEKCAAVREIVANVDWPCEVARLYRDHNVGCKIAESDAMSWFFDQEEEGIVLEDDCLPSESFFYFCDTLLEHYRYDIRIMYIAGTNLQFGQQRGEGTYYFSNIPSVWGWAGWRRVWKYYDPDMQLFPEFERQNQARFIFQDKIVSDWVMKVLRQVFENKNRYLGLPVGTFDFGESWSLRNTE